MQTSIAVDNYNRETTFSLLAAAHSLELSDQSLDHPGHPCETPANPSQAAPVSPSCSYWTTLDLDGEPEVRKYNRFNPRHAAEQIRGVSLVSTSCSHWKTLTGAARDDGASLVITDTNGNSAGRRRTVALAEGENTISITVPAEDGQTTQTYRVIVTRGPDEWVRDARSFELDRNNTAPADLWSDRDTLWVADWEERKLFAYGLPEGDRLLDRDIAVEVNTDDRRGRPDDIE